MNLFTEMNLNKITLSFASEMEKDYQAHYFKDSIKVLRIAMIFVTILYAVFGVLDVIIVPKYMNLFLTIRFAIVIPILLLALGLTYFRIFEEIWQWVLFFAYIIGGIGIAVMLTKVPENLSYYGGMILVFSSGYFFVKLRFVMATVGGWLLLLIVNILMLTLSDATPSILIAYNFFYISANIINMLAAYYTEVYYRRSYLLNIQLLNKKNELEETNINLESQVKIRTHELSQSERKYRELFNLNKYGISIFYINPLNGDVSKFVEFNEAAPKMLGYSIEEMYNLSPDQIELNVDFEQMKERKSELIAHGFVDFETILKHKSGRTVYAEFRSQLVQYNDKPAIMNIVRDISKRKQIEKALNEKDALYRTVVSNAPLVTFVTDNKGIFTLSEGSVLEKLGLRPGQVVGLSVFDVYRDSPKIIEAMNIALEGNSNRTEIEVQGLVFDVIFSPILDAAGKVIQVIGVSNEITERKQTETELKKSEEKFSRTFSVNPSAISIIDLNDNFRYIDINETFESLTGFSRSEIIGRSSTEIGLFESEQIDEYYNLLKLDKSIKGLEINFKNKNGEIKTGLISFEKIELDNHSYLISTTHDITERKKAEELLYQKNYEIESQYEEYMQLNEVLRNTNYDLENPKRKLKKATV